MPPRRPRVRMLEVIGAGVGVCGEMAGMEVVGWLREGGIS